MDEKTFITSLEEEDGGTKENTSLQKPAVRGDRVTLGG